MLSSGTKLHASWYIKKKVVPRKKQSGKLFSTYVGDLCWRLSGQPLSEYEHVKELFKKYTLKSANLLETCQMRMLWDGSQPDLQSQCISIWQVGNETQKSTCLTNKTVKTSMKILLFASHKESIITLKQSLFFSFIKNFRIYKYANIF